MPIDVDWSEVRGDGHPFLGHPSHTCHQHRATNLIVAGWPRKILVPKLVPNSSDLSRPPIGRVHNVRGQDS
jgi:hypothetical protein